MLNAINKTILLLYTMQLHANEVLFTYSTIYDRFLFIDFFLAISLDGVFSCACYANTGV